VIVVDATLSWWRSHDSPGHHCIDPPPVADGDALFVALPVITVEEIDPIQLVVPSASEVRTSSCSRASSRGGGRV
jgi:hypothetical protein